MPISFTKFIYTQLVPLPSVASFTRPLTGRTVLLTGGNVGLGFEAAKHLAALGPARLIITSRSAARAADAVKAIEQAGKGKVGKVECWEIDQASFDSVKAFAARFERESGGVLDLLVLNAGVANSTYEQTQDGWETMLQVNHLSTALLALRLLPFLSKAERDPPTPRLVITNSGLHHQFENVPEGEAANVLLRLSSKEYCEQEGKMANRYPLTKLFNVLFTVALASHLPTSAALEVNTVNPGFCKSQLARNLRSWGFWVFTLLLARSTEAGSRTLVHAAVGADLDGKSGAYVEDCKLSEASTFVMSEKGKQAGDKLWEETIEQLSLVDPDVPKIVQQYLS